MEDFDLNLDFNFNLDDTEENIRYLDICGLVKKSNSKERKNITFDDEKKQLGYLIDFCPNNKQEYRLISVAGGFSSLGIIKYVAEKECISDLYCTTFRIGKKHFEELVRLHKSKSIINASFVTSSAQKDCDINYNYYNFIEQYCKKIKWNISIAKNHSKIILMHTKNDNYYVVETSSNLNENPKIEQFIWSNDRSLYEWYLNFIKELLKEDK